MSPALAGRFLTIAPPGKPLLLFLIFSITNSEIVILPKCLSSVFKVIFNDLTIVTLLQTFESAVQENVSINGQAWQEASDNYFMGM